MSKITKFVRSNAQGQTDADTEVNFMGGVSYKVDTLLKLKFVAASSIFGEPQYYRKGLKVTDKGYSADGRFKDEFTHMFDAYEGSDTSEVFSLIIDEALDYDFEGTINLAKELRTEYNMRLNPQVIMVRAAMHHGRKAFTSEHPSAFAEAQETVMRRADEPSMQFAYYLFVNGSKKGLPSILKRSWAKNLSKRDAYEVNKYKGAEIGMANTVKVCHANSGVIDELCRTGKVTVNGDGMTWEQLKSDGKSWSQIISSINMGHMALVRNARNIFEEIDDADTLAWYKNVVVGGVKGGKQFPFRYMAAYNAVKDSSLVNFKPQLMDLFQECMDEAMANMPRLRGRTVALTDNSGSAWGAMPSEYGTVTIAEIDNLSSVIAAKCSDEGTVAKFGDKIKYYPISQRDGILSQAQEISRGKQTDVGGNTETGIWLFFKDAISKKTKYDNIFIFSDQQAGTGGLYTDQQNIPDRQFSLDGTYVNVFACVQEYRRKVNPKVNVFSVQTAGYDNNILPMMAYRTALLTGWTGKEILFASQYIKDWDEAESGLCK